MTTAQRLGTTDRCTVIFRKLKSTGLIIAIWPYVLQPGGKVRYQWPVGTNTVETGYQSYQYLLSHSSAATPADYRALHGTLELLGYWYSVDTRRYNSHWVMLRFADGSY